jgi:hypothetical protein
MQTEFRFRLNGLKSLNGEAWLLQRRLAASVFVW